MSGYRIELRPAAIKALRAIERKEVTLAYQPIVRLEDRTIAGFEGSGTVVGAGGGAMARFLLGKPVACAAGDGDGTWAAYAIADE